MKTAKARSESAPLRDEYDFSKGERGRHARSFADGTNVILLEPDMAVRFKSSTAVNRALRVFVSEHAPRRRSETKKSKAR